MKSRICAVATAALLTSSCVSPNYDVPRDNLGDPTVASIVLRIRCELAALLDDARYPYARFLRNGDYQVSMNLSLSVNSKGGINPTFTYLDGPGFTFGGGFNLNRSREHNFYKELDFSMRELWRDMKDYPHVAECPAEDTPLSGNLGIREAVSAAITSPFDTDVKLAGGKGPFGGFINIVTTTSIDGFGPRFVTTNFTGPGGFLSASEANTDKLSYAFGEGPNAGKPFDRNRMGPIPTSGIARDFLNRILLNDIATQLSGIRNATR